MIDLSSTHYSTLYGRLCPLPSGLLQFPPLAQLFTLKALTPCRPPALKDSWSVAVLQLIQRLSQQENGDTVEVLADVETDNSATLFVTVGETVSSQVAFMRSKYLI